MDERAETARRKREEKEPLKDSRGPYLSSVLKSGDESCTFAKFQAQLMTTGSAGVRPEDTSHRTDVLEGNSWHI